MNQLRDAHNVDPSNFPFMKLQGAGNDFVVIDGRYRLPFDAADFAKVACDRHFGIGADGLIVLESSRAADFKMVYFNADGSRSICGNGMRALVRYIFKLELLPAEQKRLELEIDTGSVQIEAFQRGERIKVEMNAATFDGLRVPTTKPGEHIQAPLEAAGEEFKITAVSVGNPHCVIFCDDVSKIDLSRIGPAIEHHPFFPERTNVEFVQIIDKQQLKMRVWERGVGETLACATGVCAAFAAARKELRCDQRVMLTTPGGQFELAEDIKTGKINLIGPAEDVFCGTINVPQLLRRLENQKGGVVSYV